MSISYKHTKFLKISLAQCSKAVEKSGKLSTKRLYKMKSINRFKWIKPLHQYLLKRYLNIYKECSDHIDISISMSAFAIEAFINFYAIHFELDKVTGYNERMRTKLKWENFPLQRTGKTLPQTTLDLVQEVLNDRNDIAHYKPTTDSTKFSGHSLKTAIENINKVYKIYYELNNIEPLINFKIFELEIPEHADKINMEYAVYCNKNWKTSS